MVSGNPIAATATASSQQNERAQKYASLTHSLTHSLGISLFPRFSLFVFYFHRKRLEKKEWRTIFDFCVGIVKLSIERFFMVLLKVRE